MSKTGFTPAALYNSLPEVEVAGRLTAEDEACIAEIRDVLERRGKLDKFGVSLLHRHFALKEGEVLFEETDVASRTMTIRPVPIDSIQDVGKAISTSWQLIQGGPVMLCNQTCHPSRGGHSTTHT